MHQRPYILHSYPWIYKLFHTNCVFIFGIEIDDQFLFSNIIFNGKVITILLSVIQLTVYFLNYFKLFTKNCKLKNLILRLLSRIRHSNNSGIKFSQHFYQIFLRSHHRMNIFINHWRLVEPGTH